MGRGGARPGSGRKKKPAVPFSPKTEAASVLAKLGTEHNGQELPPENQLWIDLLTAQDLRIRLDTLKYLTDRRDGKARQGIDLNANVTIDATRRDHIRELISRLAGKS